VKVGRLRIDSEIEYGLSVKWMIDPLGIGPLIDLGACRAALDQRRESVQDRQLCERRPHSVFPLVYQGLLFGFGSIRLKSPFTKTAVEPSA